MAISEQPPPETPGSGADTVELVAQSRAAERDGRHQAGLALARSAHAAAEAAGQRRLAARALCLIAVHLMRLGRYEEAITASEQALDRRRDLDLGDVCELLFARIMACNEMGLHDEALEALDECVVLADRSGDPELQSWAQNRAGCAYDAMGDHETATPLLERALEYAEQAGEPFTLFAALNNLAENLASRCLECVRQGEPPPDALLSRARQIAERGRKIGLTLDNPHCQALAWGTQGLIRALSGDLAGADEDLDRAHAIARSAGVVPLRNLFTLFRGQALLAAGKLEQAAACLRRALADAERNQDNALALQAMRDLKAAYQRLGDYRAALEVFERFYRVEREAYRKAAGLRLQMMADRLELERARLEADRARLEARLLKMRQSALESEKQRLLELSEELNLHARQDALTGAWNRRYFDERWPQSFHGARQAGEPLSIAMIDVDHFKPINDRHGHDAGDEVLREVAGALRRLCRPTDVLARYGGEEFALILPQTDEDTALHIAQRLCAAIRRLDLSRIVPGLVVTVSIGVCGRSDIDDPTAMIREADRRLYAAKQHGRNRVEPSLPRSGADPHKRPPA